MVRHKSRWMLLKIEQEDTVKNLVQADHDADVNASSDSVSKYTHTHTHTHTYTYTYTYTRIEKKNIYHALCAVVQDAFGICGVGMVDDIQIKLFNNETKMAIIQVPRDHANTIHAALSILTSVEGIPIVATVFSTHGSARTMKIAALTELRRAFDRETRNDPSIASSEKKRMKRLRRLEDHMEQIRNIE